MDKQKSLKIGGAIGIIAGAIALYLGGGTADSGIEIIGGVFVLAGIVANLLRK